MKLNFKDKKVKYLLIAIITLLLSVISATYADPYIIK